MIDAGTRIWRCFHGLHAVTARQLRSTPSNPVHKTCQLAAT
jgi:hypothetical protein